MSPFWQDWQPVGTSVGVNELKFAWSVGTKVGKDVRVGKCVTPVNALSKRVGGRVRSMVESTVGVLELY